MGKHAVNDADIKTLFFHQGVGALCIAGQRRMIPRLDEDLLKVISDDLLVINNKDAQRCRCNKILTGHNCFVTSF